MAFKQVEIPGIGLVGFYKRRGSRSIRLRLTHDGKVTVTMPYWTPYQAAIHFVSTKASWIEDQREPVTLFVDGQSIGKAHHLSFIVEDKATRIGTKLRATEAIVLVPQGYTVGNPAVQAAARLVSLKALKKEAESLLPIRLHELALKYGFSYSKVSVRQLKSRWGSCSHKKEIQLNIFLMQLPWHLIDYVLLHELVHTKVLRHGPPFWEEFERNLSTAKKLRKEIRQYHPTF